MTCKRVRLQAEAVATDKQVNLRPRNCCCYRNIMNIAASSGPSEMLINSQINMQTNERSNGQIEFLLSVVNNSIILIFECSTIDRDKKAFRFEKICPELSDYGIDFYCIISLQLLSSVQFRRENYSGANISSETILRKCFRVQSYSLSWKNR